jgi:hypothetical protein
VPPQPLSRLPLFVTGAGLTAVQAPSGCGLLGAGGQWAVPPRYGRIEQYGNLLVAFAAASNADSTTSAALLDPQGRLLRELPRTYSSYFENKLRWLYLTQKTPAGQMTTSLLDQAGRTLLTLDGYYSIIRIATNAHSSQRHYLVQVSAERTPNGEADLPHGRPGGYMSISGRKFWQD